MHGRIMSHVVWISDHSNAFMLSEYLIILMLASKRKVGFETGERELSLINQNTNMGFVKKLN